MFRVSVGGAVAGIHRATIIGARTRGPKSKRDQNGKNRFPRAGKSDCPMGNDGEAGVRSGFPCEFLFKMKHRPR